MTRETKLNLIFIAILLPLLAPGGYMLFKAKLDPNARPMYLPKAVRQEAAYMDPMERPGIHRVTPAKTTHWAGEIVTMTMGGSGTGRGDVYAGEISELRSFELVAQRFDDAGAWRLGLVLWDPALIDRAESLQFEVNGKPVASPKIAIFLTPNDVALELRDLGYVLPPKRVAVAALTVDGQAADGQTIDEASPSIAGTEFHAGFIVDVASPRDGKVWRDRLEMAPRRTPAAATQ